MGGESWRFDAAGIWGSGLVLTERALVPTGQNTLYTVWGGRGINGPRDAETLDPFPLLTGTLTWEAFLERYGHLGDACQAYETEALGVGCDATCSAVIAACGEAAADCLDRCALLPRALVDCRATDTTCAPDACGWPVATE